MSTNFVAGWIGGLAPEVRTNGDGYLSVQAVPAVAINHPPKSVVVTNYAIGFLAGTNAVELMVLHSGE